MPILSCLIFLPLLAALVILFVPKENIRLIRAIALTATFLVLAKSIKLLIGFDPTAVGVQFVEKLSWIPMMNIWYFLGADGLSIPLIFLTGLLGFLACIASETIKERQKEFYVFYLLLMTGMLGTFLALDLFLFYIFWELVLIPMYFLIGIWGGPRREYAAIKFFLYTLVGSVVMLLGILTLYFNSQPHSFDMLELKQAVSGFDLRLQILLFLSFFLAFAIKVPVFPFHTWLPDAHVEAPTPISVILAGVLLKMGGYGFFRICAPLMPDGTAYFAQGIAILGMINILYGAFVALAQTDFKKMIAYSSVSHMGFVLLGFASLNATGFNGAMLEMFNHGIITGAMFLLVGYLYERTHTRDLTKFGGLLGQLPVYAFFLYFFTLGSLGMPGLSGFVGEFMSLAGAFPVFQTITIITCLGLIMTAVYFLIMLRKVLLEELNSQWNKLADLNRTEFWVLIPLLVITVVIGFYPKVILDLQALTVQTLLAVK